MSVSSHFKFSLFKLVLIKHALTFCLSSELFSTVVDMLATLIHSTLVSDSLSEKGEENRKHHQNLIKKLKKVI